MELFNLRTSGDGKLAIQEKENPKDFKEINGKQEKDLVQMIVEYPWLLNIKLEYESSDLRENPDLLIIGEESRTSSGKRADLLAIDQEGNLIVIEAKRDAADEKARKEPVEFQAIRYAAASRKMTSEDIIQLFAKYLKDTASEEFEFDWQQVAIKRLCTHLSDGEDWTKEDLNDVIDAKNQKIYLVAASYFPETISACAWLREHKIEIFCFRLRPYQIGGQWLLEREMIIPPPGLDDLMQDMAPSSDQSRENTNSTRTKTDKAQYLTWQDEDGSKISVNGWTQALAVGTQKALKLGLPEGDLPMNHCADEKDFDPSSSSKAMKIKDNLFIDKHGSADQICKFLSEMFRKLNKEKGFLQITTRSGEVYELPD